MEKMRKIDLTRLGVYTQFMTLLFLGLDILSRL